jgi:hypothetical protein
MEASSLPFWGIAIALAGLMVTILFKSPKEYHGDTDRRVYDLENKHNALAQDVARTNGGVLKAIEALTKEVDGTKVEIRGLAAAITTLAGRRNGGPR